MPTRTWATIAEPRAGIDALVVIPQGPLLRAFQPILGASQAVSYSGPGLFRWPRDPIWEFRVRPRMIVLERDLPVGIQSGNPAAGQPPWPRKFLSLLVR